MRTWKCNRCDTTTQEWYCEECSSCGMCGCCPCYRVGCEYCPYGGIHEGESVRDYHARIEICDSKYEEGYEEDCVPTAEEIANHYNSESDKMYFARFQEIVDKRGNNAQS